MTVSVSPILHLPTHTRTSLNKASRDACISVFLSFSFSHSSPLLPFRFYSFSFHLVYRFFSTSFSFLLPLFSLSLLPSFPLFFSLCAPVFFVSFFPESFTYHWLTESTERPAPFYWPLSDALLFYVESQNKRSTGQRRRLVVVLCTYVSVVSTF